MSTTTSKSTPTNIQFALDAVLSHNSRQSKIKKHLLEYTNMSKPQRRAVMQLIQYFESEHSGQATQCTQEKQVFIAQNEHKRNDILSSELSSTHDECAFVTKNPNRKRKSRKKKNETTLIAPVTIPEVTIMNKSITEIIPTESKDSSTQTVECVVSLQKYNEIEEEVKYLKNTIQDQFHRIRYLKEKTESTSAMMEDYNELKRKDYETSDSHLELLNGQITKLGDQLESTKRSLKLESNNLVTAEARNCDLNEQIIKERQQKLSTLDQLDSDSQNQRLSRESIRTIRKQIFIELKAKIQKDKGMFKKLTMQQEYDKILFEFSNPQLQQLIINKAARLMNLTLSGTTLSINDFQVKRLFPLFAKINEDEEELKYDLKSFTLQ